VVSLADFSVAFIAGLVVFPVIFALNLSGDVGESTVGALFISLPGAFVEMGAVGRIVGLAFFLALVLAALTSAISLLEVVTASLIDELRTTRRAAAVMGGLLAASVGLFPALSLDALGVLDKVAGELLVLTGVLGTAFLVGWIAPRPVEEIMRGASPAFRRIAPATVFIVRYVVPPFISVILWLSLRDAARLN
jgi:NSS family neurotransmitter:Na+ symporter